MPTCGALVAEYANVNWTRRSFLLASLTLAGGLAIQVVPALPPVVPSGAPFMRSRDRALFLLWLGVVPTGDKPQRVVITLDDVPVLFAVAQPYWQTLWHDVPLVITPGHALYNAGDADVSLRAAFSDGDGNAWLVERGTVTNIRADGAWR